MNKPQYSKAMDSHRADEMQTKLMKRASEVSAENNAESDPDFA